MKFAIAQDAMNAALSRVCGPIRGSSFREILTHVLLTAGDGVLTMTGSDTEVQVTVEVSADICSSGTVAAPAHKLRAICSALNPGSMARFSLEGDWLTVECESGRYKLCTLPAADFPVMACEKAVQKLEIDASALQVAIQGSSFAIARDDSRVALNGLLLDLREDSSRVVATDGHRLAMVVVGPGAAGTSPQKSIVPGKGVKELLRLIKNQDGMTALTIGAGWIQFKHKGTCLVCTLLEASYPPYESVMPVTSSTSSVTIDREALRSSVERVAILAKGEVAGVRIEFPPGLVRVSAANLEGEDGLDEFESEHTTKGSDLVVNSTYLLDALSAFSTQSIALHSKCDTQACLIVSDEAPDVHQVVMPLRS